jgi:hypothetical protein
MSMLHCSSIEVQDEDVRRERDGGLREAAADEEGHGGVEEGGHQGHRKERDVEKRPAGNKENSGKKRHCEKEIHQELYFLSYWKI